MTSPQRDWPLWEVFTRPRGGLAHTHAGSVHAPDAALALQFARDVYTRRGEAASVWVVPAEAIVASDPAQAGELFDPAANKPFRHPSFYAIPDDVANL